MKNKSGSFKPKKVNFAQVSNVALRDPVISLKAKGLYALIQSYITIENFILYKSMLVKQCKESDVAFDSAWKELKDRGYLKQEKKRNCKAGCFYYEYELLDEPSHPPKTQGVDNPPSGYYGVYTNTDLINTDLKNTEKNTYTFEGDAYAEAYFDMYRQVTGKNHRQLRQPLEWCITIEDMPIAEFSEIAYEHIANETVANRQYIEYFNKTLERLR